MNINLSPYKEIHSGTKSIFDHIDPNFIVDDQVIIYLKLGKNAYASPGIYNHPFEQGKIVLGPCMVTDRNNYVWESNLWEYVSKYHVTLPQEFVEYAMSIEGCKYIVKNIESSCFWSTAVKKWRKRKIIEKIKEMEQNLINSD